MATIETTQETPPTVNYESEINALQMQIRQLSLQLEAALREINDSLEAVASDVGELETDVDGLSSQLKNLRFNGSAVKEDSDGTGRTITIDNDPCSGTAYVMGVTVTGLMSNTALPWIKCVRSTRTATQVAAAPASPWGEDEEYYEKANTHGDIHAFSH